MTLSRGFWYTRPNPELRTCNGQEPTGVISLGTIIGRDCQGMHRREFLRLGSAGFAGLSLADLLRAPVDAAGKNGSRPERSCILIYLAGGPSQFETFDPKPAAPLEIRGP